MGTKQNDIIIGIDLGTTNSLVAVADQRGPRIISDESGRAMTPSVVRFVEDGQPVVGHEAREHSVEFASTTVQSVKRLMGLTARQVRAAGDRFNFEIAGDDDHAARIGIAEALHAPQEISAHILQRLKSIAQADLGREVHRAVITVPAYFDDTQRQATREAGRLAGLDVVRIINEPTAAALAYGLGLSGTGETAAVFDLGGGTFDISILRIIPGDRSSQDPTGNIFQVVATAGDTHLGGDDVDQMIVNLVMEEIRDRFGQSISFPVQTHQALRLLAQATKIRLSDEQEANLEIDLGDDRRYERTITRDELESMIEPWVQRAITACKRAMRDAKLNPGDIDRVVMVGGSTRIPKVRTSVADLFQTTPYTALDPDQVVALGAAVQGAILSGGHEKAVLLDVIPLSLGIETLGGAVAKLIMRNSTVPCSAMERFSTSVDGQTSIKIHVVQGERELVQDCRSLGEFHLKGIVPMPAGIPQLEVTFHVDVNGVLDVTAVEKRSGKVAAIQIVANHGLTNEEVERIERDSFANARQDMHAHRVIDLRVNSALDVKWIRDGMKRVDAKLDDTYRADLQHAIETLESFIKQADNDPKSVDADAFAQAKQTLDERSTRLHEIAIAQSLRDDKPAPTDAQANEPHPSGSKR